jgi:ribosomal protein S18 acetylase RimI-like enzyme
MPGQKAFQTIFKKGITGHQATQLVEFSQTDPLVIKFTRDPKRFNNIETFNKWRRGKIIYTLENPEKDLLGIIWFQKAKTTHSPLATFTFAIRVYPPARGKGLAFSFMEKSFDAFYKTGTFTKSKTNGVWLSTKKSNKKAISLYKSFGFKKIATDGNTEYFILP